jgi:hypothetical protein
MTEIDRVIESHGGWHGAFVGKKVEHRGMCFCQPPYQTNSKTVAELLKVSLLFGFEEAAVPRVDISAPPASPANSLCTSIAAGFGLQRELFIESSGQSIQALFQSKPTAFDGKSRLLLHGMLESLQSIRCLDLK